MDRQDYIIEQKGYKLDDCIVYEETYSGKTKNRPMLKKLLNEVQSGDNVVITDLSRLARSVKDLWEISDELISKNATLISLKENIDLSTSSGRLVFSMLGAIYQFERDVLSDRTKEALMAKKKNGVVLGRPKTINDELMNDAILEYMSSDKSMMKVSKEFGISVATLCNKLKERGLTR
jgi:DNA invertase Pin-like site-specific DNA recombinase